MLRLNVDAGVLSIMPPKITARLEKEHAYCCNLVKNLAICQDFAATHQWERLAIHCDDLLNSPECRTCTAQSFSAAGRNAVSSERPLRADRIRLVGLAMCVICVGRQLPGAQGHHG